MADGSKRCFFASTIGEPTSDTRKRSDHVLRYIIREALSPLGYECERADEVQETGSITTQVIRRLIDADLVVADLTDHNPNVFYELAVRHCYRRPALQVIAAGGRIPFDVYAKRTIQYDLADLDSVAAAKCALAAQVKSLADGSAQPASPVSVAVDLEVAASSGDRRQVELSQVVSGIAEIRSTLTVVQRLLESPNQVAASGTSVDVLANCVVAPPERCLAD